MKILFVIASIKNGGAERVLNALSNHLIKKHDVLIAVMDEDFGLYDFDSKIEILKLNIYNTNKYFIKFRKIYMLRSLFKDTKPDLIISFIDWTNVSCVIANFGLKSKLIATEHHCNEYMQSKFFRFFRDICYRFVDGLTLLNKSDLKYYSFVKNKVVLYNPIFIKDAQGFKKQNIILSVARLEYVKGYDIYFKALSMVDKRLLDGYKIVIAGDGSLSQELKDMALGFGLEIEFLGHIKDIQELYAKAKIFVLSSRSEGLSNVLIESAYFSCARISSNTVGAKELILNGVDGLIYDVYNEDELCCALSSLLHDESLIIRLGQNAKNASRKFDIKNIMKGWDNFIKTTLAKDMV